MVTISNACILSIEHAPTLSPHHKLQAGISAETQLHLLALQ